MDQTPEGNWDRLVKWFYPIVPINPGYPHPARWMVGQTERSGQVDVLLTPLPLADGTERRLKPETEAPPEDMVLIQAPWVGAPRCEGGGWDSLIMDLVSKSPALAPPSDGDLRTFML